MAAEGLVRLKEALKASRADSREQGREEGVSSVQVAQLRFDRSSNSKSRFKFRVDSPSIGFSASICTTFLHAWQVNSSCCGVAWNVGVACCSGEVDVAKAVEAAAVELEAEACSMEGRDGASFHSRQGEAAAARRRDEK